MRHLYDVLMHLALPFLFLRLLWKSRADRRYREHFGERVGMVQRQSGVIWLHAVSAGESIAARPLIERLLNDTDHAVLVTATTPTGREQIAQAFSGQPRVRQVYAPWDVSTLVRRFIRRVNPVALLLMETELWPNMLAVCAEARIPTALINGRLSAKSAQGYGRVAAVSQEMMRNLDLALVQTPAHGRRFLALGLDGSKLRVCGSIKFDQNSADLSQEGAAWRQRWGAGLHWRNQARRGREQARRGREQARRGREQAQGREQAPAASRPVLLAASTHADEEAQLLAVFEPLMKQFDALLILAPRHAERAEDAEQACARAGFASQRISDEQAPAPGTVLIVDAMGLLNGLYAAADIAFVGGSLVDVGGHNILEPAAQGAPVMTGPMVRNFEDFVTVFEQAGALLRVASAAQWQTRVAELLADPDQLIAMGQAGRAVVAVNRGALERVAAELAALLRDRRGRVPAPLSPALPSG